MENERNNVTEKGNRNIIKFGWIVIAIFILVGGYFLYRTIFRKPVILQKQELGTGIVEVISENNTADQPQKQYVAARANGQVSEKYLKSDTSDTQLGKATVAELIFSNSNGDDMKLEVIVQYLDEASEMNLIPEIGKEIYRLKTGKELSANIITLDEWKEIFIQDSLWLFMPLFKTNIDDKLVMSSGIIDIAKIYYSDTDWEMVDAVYKNRFIGVSIEKPLLVSKISPVYGASDK